MPQPDPGDSGRCAAPLPPVTATCAQREPDVWTRIKTEATPAARSRAARQSEPGELRGHRHGGSPAAAALPRPRPHACPRPATIAHHRRPPAHRSPPRRVPSALRSALVAAPPHARPHLLSARPPRGSTSIPGARGPAAATAPPPSRGGGAPAPPPRLQSWPPQNYISRRAPRPPAAQRFPARPARSNDYSSRQAVRAVCPGRAGLRRVAFELCLRGVRAPLPGYVGTVPGCAPRGMGLWASSSLSAL